ncbi:MAG: hypothetical protein LW805_02475 [Oxalobacteraceae bacterium]|jgi:hypothetical protein|nr:hypothetical protein [Oxalobacteraceae bacterium]
MHFVKKLLLWSVFFAFLITGFAGITAGSALGAGAAWLGALIVLPAVHRKLIEKTAIFRNQFFKYGLLSVFFITSILSISSAQSEKDKNYYVNNKEAILKEVKASIDGKQPNDAISVVQKYLQYFPEDADLGRLKVESDLLLEKINKESELATKAESEKNRMSAQNKGAPVNPDGPCIVSGIAHDKAFFCAGPDAPVCGMDDRTVLIVNGEVMPPHATNTQMVKLGFRCECTKEPMRTAHAKIECKG